MEFQAGRVFQFLHGHHVGDVAVQLGVVFHGPRPVLLPVRSVFGGCGGVSIVPRRIPMGVAWLESNLVVGASFGALDWHFLWGVHDSVCQSILGLEKARAALPPSLQWLDVSLRVGDGMPAGGQIELGLPGHQFGGHGGLVGHSGIDSSVETRSPKRQIPVDCVFIFHSYCGGFCGQPILRSGRRWRAGARLGQVCHARGKHCGGCVAVHRVGRPHQPVETRFGKGP